MNTKYMHQLWRRTGVATRGIKPSVTVAREHCNCTCPRRVARKWLTDQLDIGSGESGSRSPAKLTLEGEFRASLEGRAKQSAMHPLGLLF